METVYSKFKRPKNDTTTNAIKGKNNNFIIEVKPIIALLLERPLKSIDKPNEIIIKGMAPSPK